MDYLLRGNGDEDEEKKKERKEQHFKHLAPVVKDFKSIGIFAPSLVLGYRVYFSPIAILYEGGMMKS